MRLCSPGAQANYFECDGAVETFLPGAINYTLTAPADFLQQLIVAKLHLHPARLLRAIVVLLERSQSSSKQTNAAKSARRIGKDGRAAFYAHALNFVGLGIQSRSSLLCTDRNSLRGYAWSTEMKWRSSSSTSPGTATVWAISSRNNCR